MTKEQVCALFAAHQMVKWEIPIVELTMPVPGALGVIEEPKRTAPDLIMGAGTVLDVACARADCRLHALYPIVTTRSEASWPMGVPRDRQLTRLSVHAWIPR